MDPVDNLTLAHFLSTPPAGPPPEASIRCACGRAYYGAHAVVRDALSDAKFRLPASGEAHGQVINLLKASSDLQVRAVGNLLDQLRATRKSADYQVGSIPVTGTAFERRRAAIALAQARSIVEEVERARKVNKRLSIP